MVLKDNFSVLLVEIQTAFHQISLHNIVEPDLKICGLVLQAAGLFYNWDNINFGTIRLAYLLLH